MSAKAATASRASGTSVMKTPLETYERPRDHSADGGLQPVEELVEMPGEVGLDVEDRQRQHEHEAGQHEAEASEEAAELAAPDPAEVDAQLVRLRARKHLVDGERLLEGLLVDPVLLVDALALEHRDLRRGAAPGERAELQEANEDCAWRISPHRGAAVSRKAALARLTKREAVDAHDDVRRARRLGEREEVANRAGVPAEAARDRVGHRHGLGRRQDGRVTLGTRERPGGHLPGGPGPAPLVAAVLPLDGLRPGALRSLDLAMQRHRGRV